MALLMIWLAAYTLLAVSCDGYSKFREEIPNGNNVPHPCKPNYIWQGVGHENPKGGGTRNPFGLAFQKAGFTWTTLLCNEDSDGDGMKNGEEMGDPFCQWKPGAFPARTINITNPGVCDQYTSDFCQTKNPFLTCNRDAFEVCDSIKKPGVLLLNLTFPRTAIPATETNFYCTRLSLPKDQDYHIIASEPIIDNFNILHHMVMFGCGTSSSQNQAPRPCNMVTDNSCKSIIAAWSVGHSGICYGNNVGFRIGNSSYKEGLLRMHYTNPTLSNSYTDASGIRLYYQPVQPGDQDLASLMIGQELLEIPPRKSKVQHVGVCPSDCTRMLLSKPVNIINVNTHMHYLGKSMKVTVVRNNSEIKVLSNDETFSYTSPVDHRHDPPFVLLPGDEIRTQCVYSSSNTGHYVYFGESTKDEMCYGFLTMYPKDALTNGVDCVSFGSTTPCNQMRKDPIGKCNWAAFLANMSLANDVRRNCNLDGFCRPECRALLNQLRTHPCMYGEAYKFIISKLKHSNQGLDFIARLHSCPVNSCDGDYNTTSGNGAANMPKNIYFSQFLIFIFLFLIPSLLMVSQ